MCDSGFKDLFSAARQTVEQGAKSEVTSFLQSAFSAIRQEVDGRRADTSTPVTRGEACSVSAVNSADGQKQVKRLQNFTVEPNLLSGGNSFSQSYSRDQEVGSTVSERLRKEMESIDLNGHGLEAVLQHGFRGFWDRYPVVFDEHMIIMWR